MKKPPDFQVLLFDLGGVLVDFAGFEELARLLPGSMVRSAVRARWIASPSVQQFERAEITPEEFADGVLRELQLDLKREDFIAAFIDWARGPYPGARALLEHVRRDYRLACLSNSNELHTPLHRRSMEPMIEKYYFSDELGLVKPEPEIYRHVILDLGVAPQRIAFFDDTPINVDAAREFGISAFRVDGVGELEERLSALGVLSRGPAP
jgi:putative hydrolase of the HAD superfamily